MFSSKILLTVCFIMYFVEFNYAHQDNSTESELTLKNNSFVHDYHIQNFTDAIMTKLNKSLEAKTLNTTNTNKISDFNKNLRFIRSQGDIQPSGKVPSIGAKNASETSNELEPTKTNDTKLNETTSGKNLTDEAGKSPGISGAPEPTKTNDTKLNETTSGKNLTDEAGKSPGISGAPESTKTNDTKLNETTSGKNLTDEAEKSPGISGKPESTKTNDTKLNETTSGKNLTDEAEKSPGISGAPESTKTNDTKLNETTSGKNLTDEAGKSPGISGAPESTKTNDTKLNETTSGKNLTDEAGKSPGISGAPESTKTNDTKLNETTSGKNLTDEAEKSPGISGKPESTKTNDTKLNETTSGKNLTDEAGKSPGISGKPESTKTNDTKLNETTSGKNLTDEAGKSPGISGKPESTKTNDTKLNETTSGKNLTNGMGKSTTISGKPESMKTNDTKLNKTTTSSETPWKMEYYGDMPNVTLWPDAEIPCHISFQIPNGSSNYHDIIHGIKAIEENSCIRFPNKIRNGAAFIYFHHNKSETCDVYTTRGYQPGTTILRTGCGPVHIIQSLMHILGLFFEHNRPDRDEKLDIKWSNIMPDKHHFFKKYNENEVNTLKLNFSYYSVMMFNDTVYANREDMKTMLPKDKHDRIIPRKTLEDVDVMKILRLYNCSYQYLDRVAKRPTLPPFRNRSIPTISSTTTAGPTPRTQKTVLYPGVDFTTKNTTTTKKPGKSGARLPLISLFALFVAVLIKLYL